MTVGFFLLTVLLIMFLSGAIYALKWSLGNVPFSENPKTQRVAKIIVKALIVIISALLAYVVFETLIILISPLFDQLNAAFSVAISKIIAFFDKLIPWVVIGGIGRALVKEYRFKKKNATPPPPAPPTEADIEVARIEGKEQYPMVHTFMFRVTCAASQNGDLKRMSDPHDIECRAISGEHFYLRGVVPVYQFELTTVNEATPEMADSIRDDLQDTGEKYISEYPSLISEDAKGRAPFEILTVHPLGKRVCVDVVLTTSASIDLIDNTREARAERRMKEKQERPNPYIDPDYGE